MARYLVVAISLMVGIVSATLTTVLTTDGTASAARMVGSAMGTLSISKPDATSTAARSSQARAQVSADPADAGPTRVKATAESRQKANVQRVASETTRNRDGGPANTVSYTTDAPAPKRTGYNGIYVPPF